ncbi:ferredoxin-thioredoxin1 [Zea mays]|uniref:Ferredoxin-thioredoxin reductase catalytic chain, chloroplastic n=1 Tax=Zea mays TaxID=4577 RepID=A0A1D6NVI5_MAIZE|nr:ferredoxin-thioredoxin1 [Zea mays]
MTSTVTTTVGCGGLPVRPLSTATRGRPRRCAVRAQAAGADASNDKSVEVMRKFSEQYARRSNTFFCADKTVTAVVIKHCGYDLHLVCRDLLITGILLELLYALVGIMMTKLRR